MKTIQIQMNTTDSENATNEIENTTNTTENVVNSTRIQRVIAKMQILLIIIEKVQNN